MVKKIILIFVFLFGIFLMVNNAYHYPVTAGYDAKLHLNYAKIISNEWRLPELTETQEGYNPPLFYITSGLLINNYSKISGIDFYSAAKIWQYFSIFLVSISLFLWYKIFNYLFPKNKITSVFFISIIFSLPVFHKTIVMYSIELWFLFTVTLTLWWFILKFQEKPNIKKTIILGLLLVINLLTRMSAITLVLAIFLGIIGLLIIHKINIKKTFVIISILLIIIILGTGWFYIGRKDKDIYGVGEGWELDTPFFERQPLSFYVDIPFKLMMTYPVRQSNYINKLIPIYYNEFWGDYWNYFPQRRYGITIDQIRKNRELTNAKRIANLVLQNKINFIPTIMMLLGVAWGFINLIKNNKRNEFWVINGVFLILNILTWLGFIAMLTKYPSWKGDSIKPSYMLYNIPIFIYFMVAFIFTYLKKNKLFFLPVIISVLTATICNLYFSWF